MRKVHTKIRSVIRKVPPKVLDWLSYLPILRSIGSQISHPWFDGRYIEQLIGEYMEEYSRDRVLPNMIESPILFLARGHSGTTPLARILSESGVYMGDYQDKNNLNRTLDALYWVYGFQRTLLPRFFEMGDGCRFDNAPLVSFVGKLCTSSHLKGYIDGPWGFKTCGAMFSFPLYNFLFPEAKYIYLVRDGRDVILSGNGYFQLTGPFTRYHHWDYFNILTYGIQNDIHKSPFKLPDRPMPNDVVMKHRFWVQAKSWKEHIEMMGQLNQEYELDDKVLFIKYEDLCRKTVTTLKTLFDFLEIKLTDQVKQFAVNYLYEDSIERWKNYENYIYGYEEDITHIFQTMSEELKSLGYEV